MEPVMTPTRLDPKVEQEEEYDGKELGHLPAQLVRQHVHKVLGDPAAL